MKIGDVFNGPSEPHVVALSESEYLRYLEGRLNQPSATKRAVLHAWMAGFLGATGSRENADYMAYDLMALLDNLT